MPRSLPPKLERSININKNSELIGAKANYNSLGLNLWALCLLIKAKILEVCIL